MFFSRFKRFVLVGTFATCVQYLLLYLQVHWAGINPVLASSLGFLVGAVVNYLFNYHYTFRSNHRHGPSILKFMVVASIGLALNTTIMQAMVTNGWHYFIAQMLATVIVLLWNFTGNTIWTFRGISPETSSYSSRSQIFISRLNIKIPGFRKHAFYAIVLSISLAIVVHIIGQYFGGDLVKSAYKKEAIELINSLITGTATLWTSI